MKNKQTEKQNYEPNKPGNNIYGQYQLFYIKTRRTRHAESKLETPETSEGEDEVFAKMDLKKEPGNLSRLQVKIYCNHIICGCQNVEWLFQKVLVN